MSSPPVVAGLSMKGWPNEGRPISPPADGYSTPDEGYSTPNENHSGSDTDTVERQQEVFEPTPSLFISSTISRDDTRSQAKQEERILSHLKTQLTSGSLELNSSGAAHSRALLNQPIHSRLPPLNIMQPPVIGPPSDSSLQPGLSSTPPSRSPSPSGSHSSSRSFPPSKAPKDSKWRERLKSERNMSLGACSKEDSEANIEPTGANLHLLGDEKGKRFSLPSLEERKSPNHDVGLAETLATMTEKHLGIDVLDHSKEISTFISYLLDTIQILETQADCRDEESSESDSASELQNVESATNKPLGFQVIHRISCTAKLHDHNGTLGENEPVNRKKRISGSIGWLQADKEIFNVETWLSKRPSVCFVVIRDHRCVQDQRAENERYRNQNHLGILRGKRERLRIVSPVLQKALKQVAEYRESEQGVFAMEMKAPYLFLFHHRRRLESLAENASYREVLLPLMRFLKEGYEAEYKEAEEMFLQGYVNAYHIDKLFKPNQILLMRKKGEPQVAFVLSRYSLARQEGLILQGWKWRYNGHDLLRAPHSGQIGFVPEGKMKICDLDIHPVQFAKEEDVKKLTQRGHKFWSMRDQVYTCYTGWDRGSQHQYASARFMVDTATYQIMHGLHANAPFEAPHMTDPWPTKVNRREDLPINAELLLPATVYGFNLKEKKWGKNHQRKWATSAVGMMLRFSVAVDLYVKNTHEVDWNYKAFDRLVLDFKIKEMIHALVDVQTSAKKMDDIITGKGNGLIILLHGSPGTGKTLTAESVAEIAKKPLYRVTCGDIGIDARDVERYLETVMYLGKTWDCVLLLDEADVFLEERTMADLQRNSLVSVFLRLLEYYEGILVLTSNRVGTFDEAFKSRIQVAIHYGKLNPMSRKAIWQNFFDMIRESSEEDANVSELERRLDQLASEEMNGRQIRNALLTARQLAKHRKEPLDWDHLNQVIKTSADFNKYLKVVRGHTDEQWARGESLR
ncbi:hypothetical protein CNYM01_06984 [Colletotrichum nymphaeae SA-01]|uniref:AAA+ ATPase domain-containing protein n=1 Tax=Colletotrichum nymphaeae SA-01 TaxID=1460502 RepID=A0A135TM69_9PEZI|nr:hypothetical protein CNYM01_06984 [Colletotrichum nymphaeae SA-01]